LATGKARGPDGIASEQIKWGGSKLWEWCTKLIKGLFTHETVLEETTYTWIKPIVKDKKGDLEDSKNYRGIALISVWSKVIDSLILKKMQEKYSTRDCQFGFKKGVSTKMAVQVLTEMRNIFCQKGGSLFCGFVDVTKAFDSLEYDKVWEKLQKINCGKNIANMVWRQYQNQKVNVVWNGGESLPFAVGKGVRQGSPLSPYLFAIVMDEVAEQIEKLDLGCEFKGKKINILVYADDVVVLAPTRFALGKILKVLRSSLKEKGLELNKDKTLVMEITKEKNQGSNEPIKIEGKGINWTREFKFLGVMIQNDFKWDKQYKKVGSKMNKLGNMILQQVGKFLNNDDRVRIVDVCAFDLYGIEFCEQLSNKLFKEVEKSYHWLVKRSLGYSKFRGNHCACAEGELLTWELQIVWRKNVLWEQIANSKNDIVKKIFGNAKWQTDLEKEVKKNLMEYGKEVTDSKGLKKNLKLHVEAVAILKELEKEEGDGSTE
jgi:hypothetical protein